MATSRVPRIDLLRGIAVLVVMLLHFSLTYRLPDSWLGDVFTPKAVARVVMNGNYGVTIFFVISGFLITTNSLRRYGDLSRTDVKGFYIMRIARILPPLLPALTLILVLGLAGAPSFVNKQQGEVLPPYWFFTALGSVLTFWHNVLMQYVGYFNYSLNIYWSLSVEEIFYLAFPLLCLLLRRGWLVGALCLPLVLGPVYRAFHMDNELDYLYAYLACFDSIALGCLTAIAAQHIRPSVPWMRTLTWIGAIVLTITHWSGIGGHEVFGFTGMAVGTSLLLLSLPRTVAVQPKGTSFRMVNAPLAGLRWMGRHSYELYLFHIIVLGLMRDAVPRDALARPHKLMWLLIFLALSTLVAALVEHFVSTPANRWIRARYPGRTPSIDPVVR